MPSLSFVYELIQYVYIHTQRMGRAPNNFYTTLCNVCSLRHRLLTYYIVVYIYILGDNVQCGWWSHLMYVRLTASIQLLQLEDITSAFTDAYKTMPFVECHYSKEVGSCTDVHKHLHCYNVLYFYISVPQKPSCIWAK